MRQAPQVRNKPFFPADREDEVAPSRELDPIFSTREFDVPPQAVGGLVDFTASDNF
jgi:hypothetical protein